jgi:purine-binding chemotaxis protein CheW
MPDEATEELFHLLCDVGGRQIALPLSRLVEIMRPRPVESIAGMPPFILGLSVIRGSPTPVVDTGILLSGAPLERSPSRYVTLRLGERRVALAVEGVRGVLRLPTSSIRDLPPLLTGANPETVASIAALDGALLVILQSARIVPEQVWAALDRRGGGN